MNCDSHSRKVDKIMRKEDLIKQLIQIEGNPEVVIYDDDNSRVLEIACASEDDDNENQILIIAQ